MYGEFTTKTCHYLFLSMFEIKSLFTLLCVDFGRLGVDIKYGLVSVPNVILSLSCYKNSTVVCMFKWRSLLG